MHCVRNWRTGDEHDARQQNPAGRCRDHRPGPRNFPAGLREHRLVPLAASGPGPPQGAGSRRPPLTRAHLAARGRRRAGRLHPGAGRGLVPRRAGARPCRQLREHRDHRRGRCRRTALGPGLPADGSVPEPGLLSLAGFAIRQPGAAAVGRHAVRLTLRFGVLLLAGAFASAATPWAMAQSAPPPAFAARAHRLVAARPAAAADAGASAGPVEQPAAGTAAALRETGREVGEHAAAAPGQDPCPTAALGRHDARAAPADARKRARVPQHVARGTRQGARRVRALPGAASGTAQGAARAVAFDESGAAPAVAAKRRTGAAQAARTLISRDPGLGTRDSGLGTRDSGLGTRDSGLGTREKHTNDVRDSGAVRCRERPRNDADVTPDYHLQAGPYIFPNVTSPPRVTQVLATSSSAKSGFHAPSATNSSLKLARLRAYISDACSGAPDGRFSGPITTTPLRSIR